MEEKLCLKNVNIQNISQYKNVSISFNQYMNIIFASNGVGKTTFTRALQENDTFIQQNDFIANTLSASLMFAMSQSKNIFFNEDSKTILKFSNTSQITLSYHNNKYNNRRGLKIKDLAIYSDRESITLQAINWTFGEITSLNMNQSHIKELKEYKRRYSLLEDKYWPFLRNRKKTALKQIDKNPLLKTPYSAKNIFKKDKDDLLEIIEEIKNPQLLKRFFFLTMMFIDKKNNKDTKLWYLFSTLNNADFLKKYITSFILDEINDFKNLSQLNIEKFYYVDLLIKQIDEECKGLNVTYLINRGIESIKSIKEHIILYKKNLVSSKEKNEAMANYINEQIEFHPLKEKIIITKDLSISSKGSKKSFALSTAEIKLLSLLIFIFEHKEHKTLIFDDPIVSMDYQNIYFVRNLLHELARRGEKQLIILTHDLNLADILANSFDQHKKINKIKLELNQNGAVVAKNKSIYQYPLLQLVDELKKSTSEFSIPSLTRQILEYIATTFSRNGKTHEVIDPNSNSFTFMGITHKCKFKMNTSFINDLTHLNSQASKNRWNNKKELFGMRDDVVKFVKKITTNAPKGDHQK